MVIASKTVTIREGLDLCDIFYRTEIVQVQQVGATAFFVSARRTNEGREYFAEFTRTLDAAMAHYEKLTTNRSIGEVR